MRHSRAAVLMLCLTALAGLSCDQDPARSVRIAVEPPEAHEAVIEPSPSAVALAAHHASSDASRSRRNAVPTPAPSRIEWRPDGCPPPAGDPSGPSSLQVTGPCAFERHASVSCEATGDDFILALSGKAARGATLMVYINVEHYHGPGSYEGAQVFVGVQDATSIFRWSNDLASVVVGDGEAFAELPNTRLDAESLLVNCSGPMSNYQCSGRTRSPIDGTVETISGKLSCEKAGGEK